jgi:hypothetical protein
MVSEEEIRAQKERIAQIDRALAGLCLIRGLEMEDDGHGIFYVVIANERGSRQLQNRSPTHLADAVWLEVRNVVTQEQSRLRRAMDATTIAMVALGSIPHRTGG